MLVYVTIVTIVIFIAGIIVRERTERRKSVAYNYDGDTTGDHEDTGRDETDIVIEHDQEDLVDHLYAQDNDINHLMEQEAERVRQNDKNVKNS